MKKTLLCSALLAALMSVTGGAQASLVSQGGGVVLDNVNNLLWFTGSTNVNFDGATSWAAGLTTGGLSAGSWSLSTIDQFGQLAAAAGYDSSNTSTMVTTANALSGLGISGKFWSNDADPRYSGFQYLNISQVSGSGPSKQWQMNFGLNSSAKVGLADSLAVAQYSPTAPSAVPIPAAAWLMASGLGVFGAAARKRKAQAA